MSSQNSSSQTQSSIELPQRTVPTEPLGSSFIELLSQEAKYCLLTRLWNRKFSPQELTDIEPKYRVYFSYIERECTQRSSRLVFCPTEILTTFERLINALEIISQHRAETRKEIRSSVLQKLSFFENVKEKELNLCIAFCLRVWLMINIREPSDSKIVPGMGRVEWDDHTSLEIFLKNLLYTQGPGMPPTLEIGPLFNAWNLQRLAGVDIHFTENLADHLVYDPRFRLVHVFHHSAFLKAQLEAPEPTESNDSSPANHISPIFDRDFLKETLSTFHLLFPFYDPECTSYLRELQSCNNIDASFGDYSLSYTYPHSNTHYRFYNARLARLNAILEDGQPHQLKQLWYDRRNKQQWCNLWVAVSVFILTILFGFVTSITGVIQVVIGYKALRLSGGH